MHNHLFCFGFGYSAQHLVKILIAQNNNWEISGTKRIVSEQEKDIQTICLNKFSLDLTIPLNTTHILISIPPIESQDIVLQNFLPQLTALPNLKWIGYISSTGVYGNHQGRIVSELSVTTPSNLRNQTRLITEQAWLRLFQIHNLPIVIFRASGIYGHKRNILLRIKSDKKVKIINDQDILFSRIHIEDMVNIIFASMQKITPEEIFNIADDYPCAHSEVVAYACNLLGITAPPEVNIEDKEMSEMMKEFYQDSKKVSNAKVKEFFNFKLRYPSYREGLLELLLSL
jgi:nucleoside-diphosphate-sugar epimerase